MTQGYAYPVWHFNRPTREMPNWCGILTRMVEDPRDSLRAAKQAHDDAPAIYHNAIVQALKDGVGPIEVARITGYSRETVRRIREAAGLPPAKQGRKKREP